MKWNLSFVSIVLILMLSPCGLNGQVQDLKLVYVNPAEALTQAGIDTSSTGQLIHALDSSDHFISAQAALLLAQRGDTDVVPDIHLRYLEALPLSTHSIDYLIALFLLHDSQVQQMVQRFIDTLIVYKGQSRGVYSTENVVAAIKLLLSLGDYSRFSLLNGLFDLSEDKPIGPDIEILGAFTAREEFRSLVFQRLRTLLSSTIPEYRSYAALELQKFADSAETRTLLENTVATDSDRFVRSLASDFLTRLYADPFVIAVSKNRALATNDSSEFFESIFSLAEFPSPKGLKSLEVVRDSAAVMNFRQYVSRLIDVYLPPKPSKSMGLPAMIDSLNSFLPQSADQGWLGDSLFEDDLRGTLTDAHSLIANTDSNDCARQIKVFQQRVDSTYKDATHQNNRMVTIQGWKFLYYNAQYILDRLPIPPAQFELNLNINGSGTVGKSPDLTLYDSATVVTLTATPSSGYAFVGWSDSLTGTSNPDSLVMSSNKVVTATFRLNTFTISASAGSNGSIAPGGEVSVTYGGSQTFTISPGTGYHTDSLLVDGVKVDSTSSYTFTNVTVSHTIRAVFAIDQFTITPSAGSNGTISPNGSVVVNYAGSQSFTVTPNSCYHVDSVLVDGANQGQVTSYTFSNVTAAHTIRSVFAISQYTITASAGTNGTISPSGTVSVNCGSSQTFTITPLTNYHVDSVLVDGVNQGQITSYAFTSVTAAHTIRAVFAINTFTLTVTAVNGTVAKSPDQTIYNYGTSVQLTATAATGYHFTSWSCDTTSNVNPLTITMTSNKALAATFAINTYTITATAGSNGTISPSGSVVVNYGSSQTFTISANTGYHIDSMLVDGVKVDSTSSYTFTNVTGNHTIRATFAINIYTLSVTAVNGTVAKSPDQATYNYGTSVQLTATATTGYHFASWSGDTTSTANPLTIIMTSNKTLTANFAINTYTITATVGSNGLMTPSGAIVVNYGSNQTFAISPSSCYHIDSVIVDGAKTDSTTSYTFHAVTANHSIRAVFAVKHDTLTPSTGSNGSITPAAAVVVNCVSAQQFVPSPNLGYKVDSLIVDGVKVDSTVGYTFFNVVASHTIRVTFKIDHVLSVPAKFSTIQSAIDFARSNDTVAVSPGTYSETPAVSTKSNLTLLAVGGVDQVTVQGFTLFETRYVTIKNFIVEGHILISTTDDVDSSSDVTIDANQIRSAGSHGIWVRSAVPRLRIVNNRIHDNGGNGINIVPAFVDGGGPTYIINNTIVKNGYNGVVSGSADAYVYLVNNIISFNGTASGTNGGRYGVWRAVALGGEGGMLWKTPVGYPHPGYIKLLNNIIVGNNGTISSDAPKASKDLYNYNEMLDAGDSGNWTTAGSEGTGISGSNNSTFSTVFVSSSPVDLHLKSGAFPVNHGVNSWSPYDAQAGAIPTVDFEGTTRPQGGTVDMGADEQQ